MTGNSSTQAVSDRDRRTHRWGAPAGVITVVVVAILTLPGIGVRYLLHGDVDVFHCLFSLFFSINLWICYWEMCLFFRRDSIGERVEFWRRRWEDTGTTPAVEFLMTSVPLNRMLSPTVWADVWAAYSMFDSAYADRNTYGFNIDIANGFTTPASTLLLYATYTAGFLPAVAAGILGAMLFWQWVYASSLYLVSFFVGGKQTRVTTQQFWVYIFGPNAIWVLVPMLGVYLSVRLILDGDYGVLGL